MSTVKFIGAAIFIVAAAWSVLVTASNAITNDGLEAHVRIALGLCAWTAIGAFVTSARAAWKREVGK